jgi:hypothetical protein
MRSVTVGYSERELGIEHAMISWLRRQPLSPSQSKMHFALRDCAGSEPRRRNRFTRPVSRRLVVQETLDYRWQVSPDLVSIAFLLSV